MTILQHPVLLPMATYVLYMFVGFLFIFRARVRAVKNKEVSGRYYKNYADKSTVPEKLLILERHIDNQFQVPILFFITGTLSISLQKDTVLIATLLWGFVLTRFLHSYIHLGKNNVLHRAGVFGLGLMFLVITWMILLFFS